MKPTLVLVGRPNVGKSTLFNKLTRSRDALVANQPGLTRDRHYGNGCGGVCPYLVVDTGGFEPDSKSGVMAQMAKQTRLAIDEADAILFMVDAQEGVVPYDLLVADLLRRVECPVYVIVNKAEGRAADQVIAEFHEMGLGSPMAISATHGQGVPHMLNEVLKSLPHAQEKPSPLSEEKRTSIAIVGRPNVGKSTLVNALLGEDRMIAFDQPGTTRDAIHVDFEYDRCHWTLIDTAGVRRRSSVSEAVEKFSIIKTLQAIEAANVVILVLDGELGVSDQDAHLANFIIDSGRAVVVAVNKWDALDQSRREKVRKMIAQQLIFLNYARFHFCSAQNAIGIKSLMKSVQAAYAAAMKKLPTPQLTRVLLAAVEQQRPPRHGLFRPKPRYAHQGGMNPPTIIIHGNALQNIPFTYMRYLENKFRQVFKLEGTPLRLQIKTASNNPYAPKK